MNRKKFLQNAVMAFPALQMAKFDLESSGARSPFIVRAGKNRQGEPVMKYMGVHPNDVVISGKDTDGALSVFLFTGHGVVGTPLHIHYEQDEFFTVIEGKYKFVCGDMTTELAAGDSIFLPRTIPHQWLQLSATGTLIYAVNPAGGLEDFFRAANDLKQPTQEAIDALALKFGMKHIGPPLTK